MPQSATASSASLPDNMKMATRVNGLKARLVDDFQHPC